MFKTIRLVLSLLMIAVMAVVFAVGVYSLHHSFNWHGKTTVSTNTDKLTEMFKHQVGVAAGATDYGGVQVHLNHRSVSFLPKWIAGSCLTLKNGQGKVDYYSDWRTTQPDITKTATGYEIVLPDPQPVTAAITLFNQSNIKTHWDCGLIVPSQPDVQGANAQLMNTLCGLARDDTAHLQDRRDDASQAVQTLAQGFGVHVHVDFKPSARPKIEGCL